MKIIDYLISKPENISFLDFERLTKKEKNSIKTLVKESEQFMVIRYILYYNLIIFFNIFFLYYCTIFCTVYRASSINWMSDGLVGLYGSYVKSLLFIFGLSVVRCVYIKTGYR